MNDEFEAYRAMKRWVVPLLAFATLTAFGMAVAAYRVSPPVPDLYNLVYHNSRPSKGENPAIFLFSFPLMLGLGCAIAADGPYLPPRNRGTRLGPAANALIILLWTGVLFIGSLHRSLVVLHHQW